MSTTRKTNDGSAMASRCLRVLFVEDSEADAFLLERALKRGGIHPICERVCSAHAMSAVLDAKEWDLILADHAMPGFSAPAALELMKEKGLDLPFIIVSGHIEEETAVAAMKAGAHDYIMKDRLARLVPAVERELREAEVRRAQARSEEALRRAHDELELRVEKRTADLKSANQKLQNVLEERRRLENELLEIAENERRRIGFDLHDDLGQKLTGVSMMVKGLEQGLERARHEGAEAARKIRGLIDEVIHHTHNLAHQFSSLDADGDDLPSRLAGLAANVEKMFGIDCSLAIKGEIPQLSGNATLQLYKIAQEAISNAIKHAKATRVSIGVDRSPDKLVVTIRNDGVPFTPPADPKSRMGLRIMNYRANTIGATFEIKAQQKNGTIVTCTLPMKNGMRNPRHHEPHDAGHHESKNPAPQRLSAHSEVALRT